MLGKTVFEIEHTMSSSEIMEWKEYLSLEPTNSIEIQLALLTKIVVNAVGGKATVEDFLITQYKQTQDDSPKFASEQEILGAFASISI